VKFPVKFPWSKQRAPEGASTATTRVLVVCAGNICRSPTALGVMRHKLQKLGLHAQVEVDAAGTHGYHVGEAPDSRAIKHAALRGYDLSKLRARRVVKEDFDRFDWVLAMDRANLERLEEIAPEAYRAKVGLLLEYARTPGSVDEVPDPYYGPPAGFERVLDLIEDACEGFLAKLAARTHGTS
jgi:protein-tyrosine phosphatase